jgi:hypothetical protein
MSSVLNPPDYYREIVVPAHGINLVGNPEEPPREIADGSLEYDNAADERAFITFNRPLDWKYGTDIELKIYWTPATIAAGNVVWYLILNRVHPDGSKTLQVINNPITVATSGSTTAVSVSTIILEASKLGTVGMLVGAFGRKGDDAADTYTGSCYLHFLKWRYITDKRGSRE